jgi:A/G-specific adenine glycosylase
MKPTPRPAARESADPHTLAAVEEDTRSALLNWYVPRRGAYPWRRTRSAYRVLVSEVMLQQTQVARVVPVYEAFLRRFPTLRALARARRSDVIRAWSGLGYNRRAVALSEVARVIVRRHGGRVPSDPATLRALPGIGPYTASAVASVGFGVRVPAIDTNARRVVARAVLGAEPSRVPAAFLRETATAWMPPQDPGGWNQAVMDLGRLVCRPVPRCQECPLAMGCRSFLGGSSSRRRAAVSSRPRPPVFEGSSRQLRGEIVEALRARALTTVGTLTSRLGRPADRVVEAINGLVRDGLVHAGPAALAGRTSGQVRLGG